MHEQGHGRTITGNANLVKQVVFPLEVLPVKGILATLFTQAICLGLLTIYIIVKTQTLPWTYVLLPAVIALQIAFMAALAFFLAALGPFFRDVKDFVQVFSVIGVYLIPVVYLPDMVPALVRPLLYANPFSHLVGVTRTCATTAASPHPWSWGVLAVLGACGCGAQPPLLSEGQALLR